MMTLSAVLTKCRLLSSKEENTKLARMRLLAVLYPMKLLWQESGHSSWHEFLRREHLAPYSYFMGFCEATKLFSKSVIDLIGADAAYVLARNEPHLREPALKMIRTYVKDRGLRPSLRRVYMFIRALRLTVVVRRVKGKTVYATRH
jgi:hypothetical protein